jgi:hypothetical protein
LFSPPGVKHRTKIDLLDQTHPVVVEWQRSQFKPPQYFSKILSVRAYPKALLQKPESPLPDPPFSFRKYVSWEDRFASRAAGSDARLNQIINPSSSRTLKRRSLDMTFRSIITKKIHKSAVIRRKMATKLKAAISLIVVRGADAKKSTKPVEESNQPDATQTELCFDSDEGGYWILSGNMSFVLTTPLY